MTICFLLYTVWSRCLSKCFVTYDSSYQLFDASYYYIYQLFLVKYSVVITILTELLPHHISSLFSLNTFSSFILYFCISFQSVNERFQVLHRFVSFEEFISGIFFFIATLTSGTFVLLSGTVQTNFEKQFVFS